ncbi:hypothetical protein [Rhizobium sp. SYY.PMSO]|uniref:hypothetical protein n=1 Tax=Rhizobium sp. SYY.PMSO TaxID=3382192 RepID=UPI00398FEDAF
MDDAVANSYGIVRYEAGEIPVNHRSPHMASGWTMDLKHSSREVNRFFANSVYGSNEAVLHEALAYRGAADHHARTDHYIWQTQYQRRDRSKLQKGAQQWQGWVLDRQYFFLTGDKRARLSPLPHMAIQEPGNWRSHNAIKWVRGTTAGFSVWNRRVGSHRL